ncbi:hypothetical protein D3C87_1306980 [compost metagenome]
MSGKTQYRIHGCTDLMAHVDQEMLLHFFIVCGPLLFLFQAYTDALNFCNILLQLVG